MQPNRYARVVAVRRISNLSAKNRYTGAFLHRSSNSNRKFTEDRDGILAHRRERMRSAGRHKFRVAIPRPGGTASTAAKLTGLAVRHTVAASRPPDRQIHVRALFHPCRWAPQRGLLNFAAVAIFLLPGPLAPRNRANLFE